MGIWRGGVSYGTLGYVVGTALVFLTFLFSLKYGTKNIKRSDAGALLAALVAIFVWWGLENLLLAVLMVTIIDIVGYFPTARKSFEEPWSETISFWAIMAGVNILVLISIAEYNFLTVAYPVVLVVANSGVALICFFRRKQIQKPT
jgi:hypothetical protein